MTAHDLYIEARKRGLTLEPRGDKLAVMPKGACPPDFAEELRAHKAELLDWLNSPPCPGWRSVPPVGLSLDPARPSPAPADARRVVDFITRQCNGADALTEWCCRRELAFWLAYHWPDAVCCYAAARDCACWQLGCREADLRERLAAFDAVRTP